MFRIITIFAVLLFVQLADAQVFQPIDIPFDINGEPLAHTLVGGLNSPEFSKVDLNNDGVEDLYIFDKSNNAHLPFLISEENGQITYTYAYEYVHNFPNCRFWVALRDYNDDGIMDLFTMEGASQIYKGKYVNDKITFEPFEPHQGKYLNRMTYYEPDMSINFMALFADDYPAIEDIDGDGDLDVLAVGGQSSVIFYKNIAVESGYPLDSLTYILEDNCWGRFSRSADTEVMLSDDINKCANEFVSSDDREVHQTLTAMVHDEDNDGDMEGIIGSVQSPNFTKVFNTGSPDFAYMTDTMLMFPQYDVPVDIRAYPAAFYLDIDNDGISEFLAAPNQVENGEDLECSWLYRNVGTLDEVIWEHQQSNWLVDEMIDLGSNASPAFVDYNADGLMDLVIGTGGDWLWTNRGSVALFENVGSKVEPSYKLIDNNWLDFNALVNSLSKFAPAFGDMDNDGDVDLLVGTNEGDLIYAENTGGAGNPVAFNTKVVAWQGLSPGDNSYPQIADLNRDGLADLLVGVKNGAIRYFPNIGSTGNPIFESDFNIAPNKFAFGDIDAAVAGDLIGNATPLLIDRNTHYSMLLATSSVGLKYYEFSKNDLDKDLFPLIEDLGAIRVGHYIYPAVEDLNDDGFLELVVGSRRGGFTVFGTDLGVTSTKEYENFSDASLFPNPVTEVLTVKLSNASSNNHQYLIYNNLGQLVKQSSKPEISVKDLSNGVYFLEIRQEDRSQVLKFVKQ